MAAPPLPLQEAGPSAVGSSTHHRIQSDPNASPFERARATAAVKMCAVREIVSQLDAWEPGTDPIGRVALHNHLRKEVAETRRPMQEAKRASVLERRADDYKALGTQWEKTEKLAQSRLQGGAGGQGGGTASGATLFTMHDDEHAVDEPLASEHYSLRQDEEFLRFFETTREKDAQMDQALDRIHEGVLRLHDNAQNIGYELDEQNDLLDGAERKVDDNHEQVHGLNGKLKKTIHKLGKSRIIVYCVCCVIFILLIIVIAVLAKLM